MNIVFCLAQPRLIIIFRGMIFRLAPSQECYIHVIIPNIIPLFSNHGARNSEDNAMRNCFE